MFRLVVMSGPLRGRRFEGGEDPVLLRRNQLPLALTPGVGVAKGEGDEPCLVPGPGGYSVVPPNGRDEARVNGEPVRHLQLLADRDHVEYGGMIMRFELIRPPAPRQSRRTRGPLLHFTLGLVLLFLAGQVLSMGWLAMQREEVVLWRIHSIGVSASVVTNGGELQRPITVSIDASRRCQTGMCSNVWISVTGYEEDTDPGKFLQLERVATARPPAHIPDEFRLSIQATLYMTHHGGRAESVDFSGVSVRLFDGERLHDVRASNRELAEWLQERTPPHDANQRRL